MQVSSALITIIMAKAKRASLSSSSANPDPEELMELLGEEEEAFNIGIEGIIQVHLQTLKKSYNHIQKLIQTSSLIQSYSRLGKIHELENDHVVFYHSSKALQKDIESSIQVAQNITTILKSILPRHTLDYVSDNKKFFLVNFSKSENLKVSKFQKKTEFVRNKIVEVAVKLYNLRSGRIKRSILESFQYGRFKNKGTLESVNDIEMILRKNDDLQARMDFWEKWFKTTEERDERMMKAEKNMKEEYSMKEEIITEEWDEIMMKIEKDIKDLEGILFGIYVMLQTQVAISAYAISDKSQWVGTGHHDNIETLAAETNKTTGWFKSKIISFTDDIYCCLHGPKTSMKD